MSAIPWIYLLIVLVAPSCLNNIHVREQDEKVVVEDYSRYLVHVTGDDAEICRYTGGHWNHSLLACTCRDSYLFLKSSGCVRVCSPFFLENEGACLARDIILDDAWNFSDLSEEVASEILIKIGNNPAYGCKGMTFCDEETWHKPFFKFQSFTAKTDFTQWEWYKSHYEDFTVMQPVNIEEPDEFADVLDLKCKFIPKLLAGVDLSDSQTVDWSHACRRASNLLLKIKGDSVREMMDLSSFDNDCKSNCKVTLNQDRLIFSIYLKNSIPVFRALKLSESGLDLMLVLSPLGNVSGASVEMKVVEQIGEKLYLKVFKAILNHQLDLIGEIIESHSSIEDRLPAEEDLRKNYSDDWKEMPTAALIVDSPLDFRSKSAEKVFWTSESVIMFNDIRSGRFRGNAVGGIDARSILSVVNLKHPALEHGQDVFSAMSDGLTKIRFYYSTSKFYNQFEFINDLDQLIKKYSIRVVNMSFFMSWSRAQCQQTFGLLFFSNPNTIFVTGAGNDGVLVDRGTCPVMLANDYFNLVTVAESDGKNHLSSHSNFGAEKIRVASPSENEKTNAFGGKVSGTSIASALVSRSILRFLEKWPSSSTIKVLSEMYDSCTDDKIDVTCGGMLQNEVFLKEVLTK